jgi:hypothetical protein
MSYHNEEVNCESLPLQLVFRALIFGNSMHTLAPWAGQQDVLLIDLKQ